MTSFGACLTRSGRRRIAPFRATNSQRLKTDPVAKHRHPCAVMRRPAYGVLQACVWIVLVWGAIIGGASPVLAQTPLGGSPASTRFLVTGVTASEISPSEARIILTFDQPPQPATIAVNNSTAPVIVFLGATLAPNVVAPSGRRGAVDGVSFAQNGGSLALTLSGAAPLHVTAATVSSRAVVLSVSAIGQVLIGAPAEPLHEHVASPGDVFEVVPLKYADVSEIVGILTAGGPIKPNDNFAPQEPAFGSAGISGGFGGGGATPVLGALGALGSGSADAFGQTINDNIAVDRRLNAIILRGSSQSVEAMKAQIAKLDVAVPSVVLETVFVELTEQGARNIGINPSNANSQLAVVGYAYSQGGYPSVSNTASGGASNVSLQAAVYAQIVKGNGRIISRPRVSAQSGGSAKIITGDALPILTSIALSGVNAVSQQVQYVNVGVTLKIAPRVSDDGVVTWHVFAEVSSVTGSAQGYPTISQREATTSATVADGQSFVIGGLVQDSRLTTRSKIPLLGDVPLLGSVFKVENSTDNKTDLYIIITPHIVRGPDAKAAQILSPLDNEAAAALAAQKP